jgi:hypothetical protein
VTGGRESFACNGTPGAPIDKSCVRDEDCVVVEHRYDPCAGSPGPGLAYVGINVRDEARFEAAEAACQWPPRACAGGWWIAEDGTIRGGDTLQTPRVSCCGGLCRATLMPHLLDAGHSVTDGGRHDGSAHSLPASDGAPATDGAGGAERDAQSNASSP